MTIRDTSKNIVHGLTGATRYRTTRKGQLILQVQTWDNTDEIGPGVTLWRDAWVSDLELDLVTP